MTERRAMRARSGKRTHSVPVDAHEQSSDCGLDANRWVISDCVPDCKRCLRILARDALS